MVDLKFIASMIAAALMVAALIFYGLEMRDCTVQVEKMRQYYSKACMCPWEWNYSVPGASDVVDDYNNIPNFGGD